MKLVWRVRIKSASAAASVITSTHTTAPSTTASDVNLNEKDKEVALAAADAAAAAVLAEREKTAPKASDGWGFSWKLSSKAKQGSERDPEKQGGEQRPIRMFAPVYGGLGGALSLCENLSPDVCSCANFSTVFIGSGISTLLSEWRLDNDYTRFALLATAPFLICVSLVCLFVPRYGTFTDDTIVLRTADYHQRLFRVRGILFFLPSHRSSSFHSIVPTFPSVLLPTILVWILCSVPK